MKVDVDIFRKLVDKLKKLVDKQSKVLDKISKVTDRTSENEFFTKMFEKATHCAHLHILMHGDLTKV